MTRFADQTLDFDLHGMLRVRGVHLPPPLAEGLRRHLAPFECPETGNEEKTDVLVGPLSAEERQALGAAPGPDSRLYGSEMDGVPCVVFPYRGVPDVVVLPSPVMRLAFTPRPGCEGKVQRILVAVTRLALRQKGILLFHGAAARRTDHGVAITGPSQAGKTKCLLAMLKDGWGYLSDDKFILRNGTAYSFRRYMSLPDTHREKLLPALGVASQRPGVAARMRRRAWHLASRRLPAYLLPRLRPLLVPTTAVDPATLFDGTEVLRETPLSTIVLLVPGSGFQTDADDVMRTMDGIVSAQDTDSEESDSILTHLRAHGRFPWPSAQELVTANLQGVDLVRLVVPQRASPSEIYTRVQECLPPAS
ncbi:MAG: hypothetical protein HQ559_14955 [Lentisphaerae bacterium]|nr:hypothetical protein [Lentisphaerota bacterium]